MKASALHYASLSAWPLILMRLITVAPAGAAMADAQQEAQSPPVSLPTPSEVVRSLSDQLIGGPPSLEAPPLTDSPSENTSDPSQDASAQDADKAADDTSKPANGKNGKSNGKTAEQVSVQLCTPCIIA